MMMRAIICTASTGYSPDAVSAESMTASEPSKIALATSDASARVGREFAGHRLEHLRRGDREPSPPAGPRQDLLLHDRHGLGRQLHAEVAAGDHHAVADLEDLVEVVDRLRLLQLGDDVDLVAAERRAGSRAARRCRCGGG